MPGREGLGRIGQRQGRLKQGRAGSLRQGRAMVGRGAGSGRAGLGKLRRWQLQLQVAGCSLCFPLARTRAL